MMKALPIVFCMIALAAIGYSVGYRAGHNAGSEAVKQVALDAIEEVTAQAQKSLSELAQECVESATPNIVLPSGVTLRELKPGENQLAGMVPVVSDYGDWYDGCNYTASPEWNAAHGKRVGNMWTSTAMGCMQATAHD